MRFSIGHRLFACVLLAIVAVAATGLALMRQNVTASFSDYAANIELDRLEQLSDALARQYQVYRGWRFIPDDVAQRRNWIRQKLAEQQAQRAIDAHPSPASPASPPSPPSPASPDSPTSPDAAEVAEVSAVPPSPAVRTHAFAASIVLPAPAPPVAPVPPVAAVAPLPPLPAPPAPPPTPSYSAGAAGSLAESGVDQLALQDRVTLLDSAGRYLAGRHLGDEPTVRRSILAGQRTIGYLLVTKALRPSDAMALAFLGQLKDSLVPIIAISIALSALAAVLLAAHFRQPIQRLVHGAHALSEGRFDTRLDVARSDELGELAHSFNVLAHKLAAAEQSRQQWVADTSHELRTPLSVLRAQIEAIQDGVRSADGDTVASMLRQVLALNKLIDDLYTLARSDAGELDYAPARIDLWQLCMQQAAAFGDKLRSAGLTVDIGPAPPSACVRADPDRMRQVLTNLIENCIRHTRAGGRLALHAQQDGTQLVIVIDDSAPGVPQAALSRLGERFYRVEASRSRANGGAGLGLALCRRIVEAHGGAIRFAPSPLGGLRVSLFMPLNV